jgi:hypothetical protein
MSLEGGWADGFFGALGLVAFGAAAGADILAAFARTEPLEKSKVQITFPVSCKHTCVPPYLQQQA